MRTIKCKKRGCGYRKPGQLYLVAELGSGDLPIWIDVDMPILYEGKQFRGTICIDLDKVLAGEPMSEYLAGQSSQRHRKSVMLEPELEAFGMPLKRREKIGICREGGIIALNDLCLIPEMAIRFTSAIYILSQMNLGKAQDETLILQQTTLETLIATLASLWRLWDKCPPGQRPAAKILVRMAMTAIGARLDALEVK